MSISVKDLDPAFQGLSNKPGLDVWRLDAGQVVAVPKADHGKFFTKDAYIVLKTSGSKHGGAVTYAIHYWLGKSTTQDDAAMAAIKTVDLDAALGGKAAQYRETQGHESDLLLSYFRPCIIATPGSWGHPDPEASQPRLLQVKGRRFIHVRQVAVARSSLSHSEIFVLDTRSKLFQFTGANASKQERVKGMEVMQLLKDTQYGGNAPIAIIDDGKLDDPESNEFWDMFGGFAPIAKKSQGEDDVEVKPTPPTLYWVSGDGLQEVGAGALKKLQLEGNKCYLVDMGPTVFVWFGRISSLDERRAACIAAETQLVVGKKPPSVRVVRMPERFELPAFKACFADWPVVPVLGGGEGGNKLKGRAGQEGVWNKSREERRVVGRGIGGGMGRRLERVTWLTRSEMRGGRAGGEGSTEMVGALTILPPLYYHLPHASSTPTPGTDAEAKRGVVDKAAPKGAAGGCEGAGAWLERHAPEWRGGQGGAQGRSRQQR
ncbi:unnamed protein product [Closterium sp. Naga37s-1]|nr:unnamed protein product [Closterium sp. Naga37s-1]